MAKIKVTSTKSLVELQKTSISGAHPGKGINNLITRTPDMVDRLPNIPIKLGHYLSYDILVMPRYFGRLREPMNNIGKIQFKDESGGLGSTRSCSDKETFTNIKDLSIDG